MANLVTLGSVPYNPYNDTFARFAMQGLQMGIQQQQFRETMAARAQEQTSNLISQSTQNTFKGIEMGMQNKELNHRMQNDAFNNMLKQEQFNFEKSTYGDKLNLDKRRVGLAENQFEHQKEQDLEVDNPYKEALTAKMTQDTKFNAEMQPFAKTELELKNDKALFQSAMDEQTFKLYKDNPGLALQEKMADINYKERRARNASLDDDDKPISYLDASRRWETVILRKRALQDDLNSLGSEDVIPDAARSNPANAAHVKEVDKKNRDRIIKQNALNESIKFADEQLADLEKYIAMKRKDAMPDAKAAPAAPTGGVAPAVAPAPASSSAVVPLPSGGGLVEELSAAKKDTAPQQAKPTAAPKVNYDGGQTAEEPTAPSTDDSKYKDIDE